ncbi:DUF389 domain-containing protein [Namhaeicola litoreus]|uniref:DUF389 domain-containing protein n=1 Tax=Namhaeicola litoreus TaxID=1052145 RepID=A0ABW3Y2N4_9FLAO
MQEAQDDDKKVKSEDERIKSDLTGIFNNLRLFFLDVLDLKHNTDLDATHERINEGISMKGHTAWILIFSILIASIGLNVSSTAVVIGAMLISPLMGPILGIGFSISVNDINMLRKSLINLGIMVGLSLITSFLFFSIPIFQDATPELLARTKPDVRDVLIAVAGGLALIVAISRPKPLFNTVAGVAIATALMPPLCTAGFGLGTRQFNYFGGAMFLFTINSIFIALATFVVVKYLNFPMIKYINQAKQKRISQMASILAFVIFSFSIYLFYQLFLQNQFNSRANSFINTLKIEGVNIIGEDKDNIDYANKEIKLYVFGKTYQQSDIERWNKMLEQYNLSDTKLSVYQNQEDKGIRNDIDEIKNLYINTTKILSTKDESLYEKDRRIRELEADLRKYYDNEILFDQVVSEIKINYENLEEIGFARELKTNFEKTDTLNIFYVNWDDKLSKKQKDEYDQRIKAWMESRLRLKSVEVRRMD